MNSTIRLIAVTLIILGGGYVGYFLASAFSIRIKQIDQLKSVLTQMNFNIGFLKMTVADAMDEASKISNGVIKKIFSYAASLIREKGIPPYTAMERGFLKFRDDLCLLHEDREIVMEFAKNLGTGDSVSEENNIKAAVAKLTLAREDAEERLKRKGKLWKGLGFLGGMLLSVILF